MARSAARDAGTPACGVAVGRGAATWSAARIYGAALVAYAAVTVLALWNLLAQFTSAVPGGRDTDYFQFHWGYWWLEHALVNGLSPLWTDYVLYPHTSNLSIHTLAPIWFPVYEIARVIAGRIAGVNTIVALAFPLTALAMFAWLRRRLHGRATALAFTGGLAYAFSPFLLTHASYSHVNLIPLGWFPLILLLWDEMAWPRRLARPVTAVLFGLALWGLWLSDLHYLIWLPFVLPGYALWTLWARRDDWRSLIQWGAVALAIMTMLAWIYPLHALAQVQPNAAEYPAATDYTLEVYSLPPEALIGLAPPVETRTLGHVLAWVLWLAVGVAWMVRKRRWTIRSDLAARPEPSAWFWLAMGLIPLILALGPTLNIGGVSIPLPYALLHPLLGGQHRIPARFTGPASALLITFAALALAPWFQRVTRRRPRLAYAALGTVAVALLADVGALSPFPARSVQTYPIHEQIARDTRDFVILDVPVGTHYGWTGLGAGFPTMFYGAFHQHRMVNGWLSRIPYSTLEDYLESPLFSWMGGARALDDAGLEEAARELAGYVADWPVGYVFAYRDLMTPEQQSEWIGWLNTQPTLCPAEATVDASLIWWQTTALTCPQDEPSEAIDMGTAQDWLHIGEGWYQPEVIGGPSGRWAGDDASLRVNIEPGTDYELRFSAVAFDHARRLRVDGIPVQLLDGDWRDYTVRLPAEALADSIIVLDHDGTTSTATLGVTENVRSLAAAYNTFSLRPLDG